MAACMYEQNQGILSKTLTISRKDILGCPQEGETEQNEARGV